MKKHLTMALMGLVFLMTTGGSLFSSQATVHPLNEWAKAEKYEITVHEIRQETLPASQSSALLAGKESTKDLKIIWADVEYKNTSGESLSRRLNQWFLYDDKGFQYDPVYSGSRLFEAKNLPALKEGAVENGFSTRGWVAFAVAQQVAPARIEFLSGYVSSATASFKVELPGK